MMIPINDTQTMNLFTRQIMARTVGRPELNIDALVPALRGYIEMYGTDVKGFEMLGDMKNTAWFTSIRTNTRYCVHYTHATHQILLRRGSRRGQVVLAMDNTTPLTAIRNLFFHL